MKRIMNRVIGLLEFGDRQKLAEKAGIPATTFSDILNGKKDISSYPAVASVLREYINKRKQEMVTEEELHSQLDDLYKNIDIQPPTDEDIIFKTLTSIKIARMNRPQIMALIAHKGLKITGIKDMNLEEAQDEVIDGLGLTDKPRGFFS